jgi:hypothetical protein
MGDRVSKTALFAVIGEAVHSRGRPSMLSRTD